MKFFSKPVLSHFDFFTGGNGRPGPTYGPPGGGPGASADASATIISQEYENNGDGSYKYR